jgi:hypothetical protein
LPVALFAIPFPALREVDPEPARELLAQAGMR